MKIGAVSFRELFNSLRESNEQEVVSLAFGEIRKTVETQGDYYDFIASDGSIPCMDGETCEVLEETDDYVLLQEVDEQQPFKLSKSEFMTVFFGMGQGYSGKGLSDEQIDNIINKLCGQEVLFRDYIRKNINLVEDVLKHQGDYMDLDCMVAMSNALKRNVTYEEYQKVNRTEIYDNMGLFNVGDKDSTILNTILTEGWDFSSTTHICQLPEKYQNALREAMEQVIDNILVEHSDAEKQAAVEEGMAGRLCDMEDSLNWRNVLFVAAGGSYHDFLVPHILAELELEERE